MGAWSFADAPGATGTDSCPDDINSVPEQPGPGAKNAKQSATAIPTAYPEQVAPTNSTADKVFTKRALV